MKAIVTGGSGFLGKNIVRELIKRDIDTISYDKIKPQNNEFYNNNSFSYIEGDILDYELLKSTIKDCDYVFHTAALANIDESGKKPRNTIETNILGTFNCLESSKNNGVKKFLFASSVYTSGNKGSFYRVTKKTGEMLCKLYYEEYNLDYTILKYGSLYGSESNHWNPIYLICRDILTTGHCYYGNSPDAVREYIHILDAARETVNIALNNNYNNHTVLISGHQRIKIKELFGMIEEILGKSIKVEYGFKKDNTHYTLTPYSFDEDVPLRINLLNYVDISEGIVDCLRSVKEEISGNEEFTGHNK